MHCSWKADYLVSNPPPELCWSHQEARAGCREDQEIYQDGPCPTVVWSGQKGGRHLFVCTSRQGDPQQYRHWHGQLVGVEGLQTYQWGGEIRPPLVPALKATAHPDGLLLKRLPGCPNMIFTKVILRWTPWKETSAIVECVNKDVKNLAQCLIRSKIVAVDLGGKARASRAGKSKLAQAVGPSVQLDDYKKSTRVSDVKLRFRPANIKLKSSTIVINHTTNLIKSKAGFKSYDISPMWVSAQERGRAPWTVGPPGPWQTHHRGHIPCQQLHHQPAFKELPHRECQRRRLSLRKLNCRK